MKIIKSILLFLYLTTPVHSFSQEVKNVDFHVEKNTIVVTYDLVDSTQYTNSYIVLKILIAGTNSYEFTPSFTTGDLGFFVNCGRKKTIIWDALKDLKVLFGSYQVKVINKNSNSYCTSIGKEVNLPISIDELSSIPKPTAPANLFVSDISFKDGNIDNNDMLDANENTTIQFKLTNKGKGDAYNVTLFGVEKNGIHGINYHEEKKIGILGAGKEINVDFPLNGLMDLESGKAEFSFEIKEGNHFDADPFIIRFNTQKFKNPSIVIADSKFTTDEEGKIKLGQPVTLNIVIQNQGQGAASNINIDFTNPSNVFPANETSYHFTSLKPNETKEISYEFFANKQYTNNVIPIQLHISESYGKYGTEKTLSVSLEQSLSKTQEIEVNAKIDKQIEIDKVSLTSDVDKNIPSNNFHDENKFALIIGNEDYSSFQNNISSEMNVAYASNDAQIFKAYCFQTLGVPKENITFLINGTAGKISQAIDKINKLIANTNGKAKVIVFYAGHGLPDEKTKAAYIIPVDVSGSNISSAIKLSNMYEKLTEFPSKQVTVFLDACFTGGGRDAGLLAARAVKITPQNDFLKGNIVVFTASSGDESSLPWKEKQHGMFTYFLLKKLQESKGDVTFSDLSTFLKEKVSLESVRTNSKSQNPQTLYSQDLQDAWSSFKFK